MRREKTRHADSEGNFPSFLRRSQRWNGRKRQKNEHERDLKRKIEHFKLIKEYSILYMKPYTYA